MFLIQTRKENNQRGFEGVIDGAGDAKEWSNYFAQYEDYQSAKREAELLIQHSQHKAKNVRIVEVVCTFKSEIKVDSNSEKYPADE